MVGAWLLLPAGNHDAATRLGGEKER
jgi:hypothetical protein